MLNVFTEVKPFRRRHRVETVPDVEPEMADSSEPVLYSPIEDPLTDNMTQREAGTKILKVCHVTVTSFSVNAVTGRIKGVA